MMIPSLWAGVSDREHIRLILSVFLVKVILIG